VADRNAHSYAYPNTAANAYLDAAADSHSIADWYADTLPSAYRHTGAIAHPHSGAHPNTGTYVRTHNHFDASALPVYDSCVGADNVPNTGARVRPNARSPSFFDTGYR
jgi:hypothetical protein